MPDRYEALRAALPGATPGPWTSEPDEYECADYCSPNGCPGHPNGDATVYPVQSGGGDGTSFSAADAAYIAEADPTTVRALLDERDALRAGATAALDALRDWRAGYGDPDNRDGLIDEAGQKLYDALELREEGS